MHVIDPIIFPGGDIGKLSICGVINDLLTRGGRPQFLSLGFILEEGLDIEILEKILKSMAEVLTAHDIKLLCADTKVVASRSAQPGLMIGSTLLGEKIRNHLQLSGPQVGDAILLTGAIGQHGLAVLQAREQLSFKNTYSSDCKALYSLLQPILLKTDAIHYMRDPTRGGVSAVLHELAAQFNISFEIEESSLPVDNDVRTGLSLLGLDVLETANEGVMLLIVDALQADNLLQEIRQHADGNKAARIGSVTPASDFRLILRTVIGGQRRVPWPEALNLPRIC
jgi:hydrogenase expression/formation protein HypE